MGKRSQDRGSEKLHRRGSRRTEEERHERGGEEPKQVLRMGRSGKQGGVRVPQVRRKVWKEPPHPEVKMSHAYWGHWTRPTDGPSSPKGGRIIRGQAC